MLTGGRTEEGDEGGGGEAVSGYGDQYCILVESAGSCYVLVAFGGLMALDILLKL